MWQLDCCAFYRKYCVLEKLGKRNQEKSRVLYAKDTSHLLFCSQRAGPWSSVDLEGSQWLLLCWFSISFCIKKFPNIFSLGKIFDIQHFITNKPNDQEDLKRQTHGILYLGKNLEITQFHIFFIKIIQMKASEVRCFAKSSICKTGLQLRPDPRDPDSSLGNVHSPVRSSTSV